MHEIIEIPRRQLGVILALLGLIVVLCFVIGFAAGRRSVGESRLAQAPGEVFPVVTAAPVRPEPTRFVPVEVATVAPRSATARSTPPPRATPRPAEPEPPVQVVDARAGAPSDTATLVDAYVIQVASVGSRAGAERLQKKLQAQGYPVRITGKSFKTGKTHYRVEVGPVDGREAADAMAARLRTQDRQKTWVRKTSQ